MTYAFADDIADPIRPGWEMIAAEAPRLAQSTCRYLAQIEVTMRPNTVSRTDHVLAGFCQHLLAAHPDVTGFRDVERIHIESFKLALAGRRTSNGDF